MMNQCNHTLNTSILFDQPSHALIPSEQVHFWTFLVFEIPSLVCTIYLLYHLLFDKRLRKALHNHVIIILLFLCFLVEVIDIPLYLDAYLHGGRNSFHSSSMICLLWWFIDYGIYGAFIVFMTWASFERHILIFYHHQLLRTRLKRIIFHYIPLGIISIYMSGFYIGVIFFPPCENLFDFESVECGMFPCYQEVSWLNIWDYLINGGMCVFIEAVCSVILLIRVIWQKHRIRQPIHWRKHRKMTIQLLSISILSLSIVLPENIIVVIQQIMPEMNDFASDTMSYFFYLTYFVILLLPLVSLACLPELWPQLTSFRKRRERTVAPFMMSVGRRHPITE
ncbi:unnamed protein product [Rotaria sp. Silwood1]|nr:unnamed protein product [Rotaria sp. Silwood1]CAF3578309.1 unnamed protein product [Rotaria sp. Silwood1]CAF3658255.1 unnamed protein product [Rotaria sp. Silwood1]CAF4598551.1 unnamed protein product [Rotaria sp. Silwood1]CAF4853923.1 unnamed protein product [Rotaria sp. Silwood1]